MRFNCSDNFARIAALRREVAEASRQRRPGDGLLVKLQVFDAKLDAVRKKIVATTEGGAITGEERLRELTDQLYGALLTNEGKPTVFQQDNIIALEGELRRIQHELEALIEQNLPSLNRQLSGAGIQSIKVKSESEADEDENEASANPHAGTDDHEALLERRSIPTNFRPLH